MPPWFHGGGPPVQPEQLREFTHERSPLFSPSVRQDFAETLLWRGGCLTDDKGEWSGEFAVSDLITSFRVSVDAFHWPVDASPAGRVGPCGKAGACVGVADYEWRSRVPFYLEPKLPVEVAQGDTVQIPVSVVNYSPYDLLARPTVWIVDAPPSDGTGSDQSAFSASSSPLTSTGAPVATVNSSRSLVLIDPDRPLPSVRVPSGATVRFLLPTRADRVASESAVRLTLAASTEAQQSAGTVLHCTVLHCTSALLSLLERLFFFSVFFFVGLLCDRVVLCCPVWCCVVLE